MNDYARLFVQCDNKQIYDVTWIFVEVEHGSDYVYGWKIH